jgi:ferric-dicitrate binding protein FerR (iron transport regulator)
MDNERDDASRGKAQNKRLRRRYLAVAAAVGALAAGIAVLVGLIPGRSASIIASAGVIQGDVRVQGPSDGQWRQLRRATGPIVAGTRLRTTLSGRVALTLPGDASLRVDAGSELILSAARSIELVAGTLYLDSGTAAAAEPFQVTTPLGTVSDVGTQFEVAALDDGLRVRVREGAIRVDGTDARTLTGSAGEQVSLGADGSLERDFFLPFDSAWAWVETLADPPEIEGQPLMLFLDWVTRETGRELRFDTPATESRARTVILHGSAENLTPMRALEVILSTTDFDYNLRGDGAILVSPHPRSR